MNAQNVFMTTTFYSTYDVPDLIFPNDEWHKVQINCEFILLDIYIFIHWQHQPFSLWSNWEFQSSNLPNSQSSKTSERTLQGDRRTDKKWRKEKVKDGLEGCAQAADWKRGEKMRPTPTNWQQDILGKNSSPTLVDHFQTIDGGGWSDPHSIQRSNTPSCATYITNSLDRSAKS